MVLLQCESLHPLLFQLGKTDVQRPMLGVLFSSVKAHPVRERLHLPLRRNIPSTITCSTHTHSYPQYHSSPTCPVRFCRWSLAALMALRSFNHTGLWLHRSPSYLCKVSSGISSKGVRSRQRQMGDLQTLLQGLGFCGAVSWVEGQLSGTAYRTLRSHSSQNTCICSCSRNWSV